MTEKKKRPWWMGTSAADDYRGGRDDYKKYLGYDPDEADPDDGVETDDWIDTFAFDDYRADKGLSSVDSIWSRYGAGDTRFVPKGWKNGVGSALGVDYTTAKRIEAAQKLVQGFVDTFALDNPLRARFAQGETLGGEDDEQGVIVSHRPLLDPTLKLNEAHEIMTAQAANGAARARYGGGLSRLRRETIAQQFRGPEQNLALQLSEILDGYRIDQSFRADYPGYEDVYAPAQRYVARNLLDAVGRDKFTLEDFGGASIVNAALNYAEYTDWAGRESEQEYWKDWAERHAFDVSMRGFGDAIAEAIAHLNLPLPPEPPKPPKPPKGKKRPGDGKGEGKGKGKGTGKPEDDDEPKDDDEEDEEEDDEQDDEPKGDEGGNEGGDEPKGDEGGQGGGKSVDLPTNLGTGVSLTGLANGQSKGIEPDQAQNLANIAASLVTGRDEQELGEVYWTTNGFRDGSRGPVQALAAANGYIRRAFSRSRTSHFAIERGHKNGRIDNRSLTRIASDDYRLFSKRRAPSETRYRVWLMVDNSGSMGGRAKMDAANLAASVALAVRHIPNVALDIWAWTSGVNVASASFSAIRTYADGDPIANIGDVYKLPMGGTPDHSVLSWATKEILKQVRPGEVPVILMASDGQGGLSGEAYVRSGRYRQNLKASGMSDAQIDVEIRNARSEIDRVAFARKHGIKVLSVAIGALSPEQQDLIYGEGNHLIWRGSIAKMAKPLGDLLARVATNKA